MPLQREVNITSKFIQNYKAILNIYKSKAYLILNISVHSRNMHE